ncbi:MAG: hypothetical protein EXR00_04950 [Alphaproteobacteria bacterium]|nr:hypothetical protein [Alphaproteobacteria bacterium]
MSKDRLSWIDEDAIAIAHPLIFHYTHAAYLDSILRSGGLYATDCRYTNDLGELQGLRSDLVTAMVQEVVPILQDARRRGIIKGLDDDTNMQLIAQLDAG